MSHATESRQDSTASHVQLVLETRFTVIRTVHLSSAQASYFPQVLEELKQEKVKLEAHDGGTAI